MNEQDKQYYESTTHSVNTTLSIIVKLFDFWGIQGMKTLINPSFDEMKTQIKMMRVAIDDYEDSLKKMIVSNDSASALVLIQNIKEAIQVTDQLMSAIQKEDSKKCSECVARLKSLNISIPLWDDEIMN